MAVRVRHPVRPRGRPGASRPMRPPSHRGGSLGPAGARRAGCRDRGERHHRHRGAPELRRHGRRRQHRGSSPVAGGLGGGLDHQTNPDLVTRGPDPEPGTVSGEGKVEGPRAVLHRQSRRGSSVGARQLPPRRPARRDPGARAGPGRHDAGSRSRGLAAGRSGSRQEPIEVGAHPGGHRRPVRGPRGRKPCRRGKPLLGDGRSAQDRPADRRGGSPRKGPGGNRHRGSTAGPVGDRPSSPGRGPGGALARVTARPSGSRRHPPQQHDRDPELRGGPIPESPVDARARGHALVGRDDPGRHELAGSGGRRRASPHPASLPTRVRASVPEPPDRPEGALPRRGPEDGRGSGAQRASGRDGAHRQAFGG